VVGPAQVTLMPSEAALACATWLNSFVVCSRTTETDASFALAEQNIATILRRHPRGIGILLLVLHSDRAPDNYAAKMLALLKRFRPQILGAAALIEASGFAAAAHRAMGTSVISLSGMGRVLGLFTSLEESTTFVANHMFPLEQRAQGAVAFASAVRKYRDAIHAEMLASRTSANVP
jgi:hypothetical protein